MVFAETMWAKKDRVKVTAEKSPTSTVVATLRLGDQVDVIEKKRETISGKIEKWKIRMGV